MAALETRLRRTHVLLLLLQLPQTTHSTAAPPVLVLVLHLSFLELAWSGPLALGCCWSVACYIKKPRVTREAHLPANPQHENCKKPPLISGKQFGILQFALLTPEKECDTNILQVVALILLGTASCLPDKLGRARQGRTSYLAPSAEEETLDTYQASQGTLDTYQQAAPSESSVARAVSAPEPIAIRSQSFEPEASGAFRYL